MGQVAVARSTRPRSIKALAASYVDQYIAEKKWKSLQDIRLDIQDLYEMILYPEHEYRMISGVPLGYHEDEKVLGKTIPDEKLILIDDSISPPHRDPRHVSTAAHEWGHAIFHAGRTELFRCSKRQVFDASEDLERQANSFFEHLLMPDDLVKAQFYECYQPTTPFRYLGRRDYYFNAFGGSRRLLIDSYTEFCRALAYPLTPYFSRVSKSSLGLKFHKLGLVQNFTSERIFAETTHIGYIIREMQQ